MIYNSFRDAAEGTSDYIKITLVESSDTNFIKKQLFSRLRYAAMVPTYVVANVADTIFGIGSETVYHATFGWLGYSKDDAKYLRSSFKYVLSDPYYAFVKTINPGANSLGGYSAGKVTNLMQYVLVSPAKKFADSKYFMLKHVASRLTYAIAALAAVVTRVADGIIGLPFALLSIISFGAIKSLNEFSYNSLIQFPLAVTNFFKYAAYAVKPS